MFEADIYFEESRVVIETSHLILKSVEESDLPAYQVLFTDPATMEKFADNEQRIKDVGIEVWKQQQLEKVAERVAIWVKRWKEEDPFSAFAVFRKDSGEMIGHIVAGHTTDPWRSELGYLIHARQWHMGFGEEAVSAIVHRYLPALKANGHLVYEIVANVRLDNLYSIRILENVGMQKIGEEEKWGASRVIYHYTY